MTLKRARRSAQAIANKSAATQPKLLAACRSATYSTRAGATPKSTKSASESSSAPNREVPLNARAIRPSRPSSTAAPAIALTAHSIAPSIAKRIAVSPRPRANSVTILGIRSLSGTARKPRRGGEAIAPAIGSGGGGLASFTSSAPPKRSLEGRRFNLGGHLRNHRLARDRARIEADHDVRALREIDVDARAEADQPDALAGGEQRALVGETDDPPGDEAGDLDNAKSPRRRIDHDAVALIVLARLVEVGAHEQAGAIDDLSDAPLDRRAIHVAIEYRHEDRYALQWRRAEAELRRRRGEAGETDDAVGGSNDEAAANRGHSRRIA